MKGIVIGDGAVAVVAEDFAETIGETLGVGGVGVFADGDIELVIGTEVDGTAVVVFGGAFEVFKVDEVDLVPGLATSPSALETAGTIVRRSARRNSG